MRKVFVIMLTAVMLISYGPAELSYASGQMAEEESNSNGYMTGFRYPRRCIPS